MKTREEVEKLKKDWIKDPIWDLYDTEGFEEYRDELYDFQKEWEKRWEEQRIQREREIDQEADRLGVRGLYRRIKHLEELVERQRKAISALIDNDQDRAYRYLKGFED